jgi:hypothetical protein
LRSNVKFKRLRRPWSDSISRSIISSSTYMLAETIPPDHAVRAGGGQFSTRNPALG